MSNQSELKPCPFCGGEAVAQSCEDFIFCTKCGVQVDSGVSLYASIKHWNMRNPSMGDLCMFHDLGNEFYRCTCKRGNDDE